MSLVFQLNVIANAIMLSSYNIFLSIKLSINFHVQKYKH